MTFAPSFWPGLLFLGWLSGIVVNYLADRLPWKRSLGRAVCHACGQAREWGGYLLFRPCPHCGTIRSWRSYVTVLLSLLLAIFLLPAYGFLVFLILEYFLLITIIDIEHHVILHELSLVGIAFGLIAGGLHTGWLQALLGGIIGGGVMYLFYLGGRLYGRWARQRRGLEVEEEGLGFGDVTLSLILGLFLGLRGILSALTLGVFLAGIFGAFYLLLTRGRVAQQAIPYAPFLILGATVMILGWWR